LCLPTEDWPVKHLLTGQCALIFGRGDRSTWSTLSSSRVATESIKISLIPLSGGDCKTILIGEACTSPQLFSDLLVLQPIPGSSWGSWGPRSASLDFYAYVVVPWQLYPQQVDK